jgi:integrase
LPAWLVEAIEQTCPLEDRTPDRRVFQGMTEAAAYQAVLRASKVAKVPHYHPHDLRHRRITHLASGERAGTRTRRACRPRYGCRGRRRSAITPGRR